MSTFCHGVASAQSLDKSGEIVDIKGLDISSLASTGIVNYEHKSDIPGQICGKILTAKKIFNKSDCSNEHELYFWNKTKNPFVYITAELLDDYCQSGKDAAGILKYDHDKKDQNKNSILGFSVEGSEIPNSRGGNKMVVARGIARKVTLTSAPCNSQCVAELLVDAQDSQVKDDFDSIFKNEQEAIELFKSGEGEKIYETYLAKKEGLVSVVGTAPLKDPATEYGGKHIKAGKTKSGKNVYTHGNSENYSFNPQEHQENGEHHRHAVVISQNPKLNSNKEGRRKGSANATASGGRKENRSALSLNDKRDVNTQQGKQQYMGKNEKACELHKSTQPSWSPGKVSGDSVHYSHPEHGTVSIQKQPSGEFHVKHQGKLAGVGGVKGSFGTSKEAGSHAKKYMQAISQKKMFAPKMQNISSETLMGKTELKKAITAGSTNAAPSTLVNGAAYQSENLMSKQASMGSEDHEFQGTKKKDWKKRAKEEYERWPHKEKFEKFMSARMPHLKLGEIQAIGKCLSLKKTIDLEKTLNNLMNLSKYREIKK